MAELTMAEHAKHFLERGSDYVDGLAYMLDRFHEAGFFPQVIQVEPVTFNVFKDGQVGNQFVCQRTAEHECVLVTAFGKIKFVKTYTEPSVEGPTLLYEFSSGQRLELYGPDTRQIGQAKIPDAEEFIDAMKMIVADYVSRSPAAAILSVKLLEAEKWLPSLNRLAVINGWIDRRNLQLDTIRSLSIANKVQLPCIGMDRRAWGILLC